MESSEEAPEGAEERRNVSRTRVVRGSQPAMGGAARGAHRAGGRRARARRRYRRQVAGSDQGCVDLRRAAQRRRLVAGARSRSAARAEEAREERRHDVQGERPGGARGDAGDREPRPRREQDHLRDLVRLHGRHGGGGEEASGRLLRARDRVQERQELRQLLRCRRGRDLPVGDRGGRGDQEGRRRLHRAVPDPGDHPARERVRSRRPAREAEGEDQARVDEVVVRPGEGAQGGREPRRRRRRRDRAERRQPVRRPVRAVEEAAVGRLQQQLEASSRRPRGSRPPSTTGGRTT